MDALQAGCSAGRLQMGMHIELSTPTHISTRDLIPENKAQSLLSTRLFHPWITFELNIAKLCSLPLLETRRSFG